ERAGDLAARRAEPTGERLSVLALEKARLEPDVEVIPRQARADRNRPEEALDGDRVPLERRAPHVEAELILPGVEARARRVRVLDHVREAAIAASEDALEDTSGRVVDLERNALRRAGGLAQEPLLALDLVERVLSAPLKRRVWLRHVRRDADRDPRIAPELAPDGVRVLPDGDDAEHVLVLLGREPEDEIKLHLVEAPGEHALRRLEQLLLGDVLVDDVAHALRAGLGGEGEPRDPDTPQLIEQSFTEAVGAERCHPEAHALRSRVLDELLDER